MSFVLTRTPQTDDELYWTVYALWGVKIPRTQVCPNHSSPFEAFSEAYFARTPLSIWKASRGMGGKSRTLAYLVLTEAVLLGAETNILGGSGAQSINIHEAMRDGWDSPLAPRQMLINDSMYETRLTNGAKVRALLASQRSVRGPHPQRLRLDEIDEMDVGILDSAMGQPMPKGDIDSQVVMSSTHQYPDKTMSEMLKRAAQQGYPVHEWCIASGEKVATARGDVAIELLRPDDLVLTRSGFKPLQHLTVMGLKNTVKVTLADGRTIICTPDHLLHTPAGWVPADAALAVTTVGPDVPVGLPAPRAEFSSLSERPRSPSVLAWAHLFKMLDSNTSPVSAEMIDALVGGSENTDPHVPMSVHRGTSDLLQPVSISKAPVIDQTELHTATSQVVKVETHRKLPVYDIGVEDAHEFFVNGILVHNCWRETSNPTDGWLSQTHIKRTQKMVTKRMWEVEYDLQEPSFGSRAFDTACVEKMFKGFGDEPDHPGRQVYKHHDLERGEQYEFEPPDLKHGEYVTGADWAKEKDWTVIATFRVDVEPWRLVAYSRTNRKPYPFMVKLFNDRMQRYPGHGIHDGTGLGNVVNDYLDTRATPFIMSGRARDDMLSEFVSAVENNKIVVPKIESAYTEHKYCSLEDLYGRGKDYHLPDTVCAFALAWHKRSRRTRGARPALDVAYNEGSPWKAVG